ncbi:MAG TPA: hypothetical protein VH415_02210 [Nitrososphaeraceae archaeon]
MLALYCRIFLGVKYTVDAHTGNDFQVRARTKTLEFGDKRWRLRLNKANDEGHDLMQTNQIAWLIIYLSIGVAISLVLPFPVSFLVFMVVIILLNIVRTEIGLRKAGIGGIMGWYKSSSSYRSWKDGSYKTRDNTLKFYCMNCGNEHRKIACPKCGSRAVRAS